MLARLWLSDEASSSLSIGFAPISSQSVPVEFSRATRRSCWPPEPCSTQATYGTPPMFAILGSLAVLSAASFIGLAPPTGWFHAPHVVPGAMAAIAQVAR